MWAAPPRVGNTWEASSENLRRSIRGPQARSRRSLEASWGLWPPTRQPLAATNAPAREIALQILPPTTLQDGACTTPPVLVCLLPKLSRAS